MANELLLYEIPGTRKKGYESGGSRLLGTAHPVKNTIKEGFEMLKEAGEVGVDTRLLMKSRVLTDAENSEFRSTSTWNFLVIEGGKPVVYTRLSGGPLDNNPDRIQLAYDAGLIRWCAGMSSEEIEKLKEGIPKELIFDSYEAWKAAQKGGALLLVPSYLVKRSLEVIQKSPFGFEVPLADASEHPDIQIYAGSAENANAFVQANAAHHKRRTIGVHPAYSTDDVKALEEDAENEVAGLGASVWLGNSSNGAVGGRSSLNHTGAPVGVAPEALAALRANLENRLK